MIKWITLIALWISLSHLLIAQEKKSLSKKLKEFLKKTDTPANLSASELFYDDVIGVNFIGGSGFIRTEVEDMNPIHTSLPKINVGCGGIDYTMGAINIASKEDMKRALNSIVKNAASYAFLLALKTASPVTEQVMSEIQHWANQINGFNVNSCELASSLVSGIWPRTKCASDHICSQIGTEKGYFSDWIESRHGCKEDPKAVKTAGKEAKNQGVFIGDFNLAWEVIKEIEESDPDLQNLYLNISGTLIKKGDEVNFLPSKADKALGLLINGGSLNPAYQFVGVGGEFVDVIEKGRIHIPLGRSEKQKICKILDSLKDKILNEREGSKPMTEEEQKLIAETHFPISSLLILMGQWGGEKALKHVSLRDCAEIIAFERVVGYLEEIFKALIAHTDKQESKQFQPKILGKFKNGLNESLDLINRLKMDNYQRISEKQKMIQFLIEIEKGLRKNPASAL